MGVQAMAQQRLPLADELKRLVDDLRADRDVWRDQAQRLALPSPEPTKSWWRWLRSTG